MQSVNQTTDQTTHRPTNQSIRHAISQHTGQPTNQPLTIQPFDQLPINRQTNQPINQITPNQLIHRPINHTITILFARMKPTDRPTNGPGVGALPASCGVGARERGRVVLQGGRQRADGGALRRSERKPPDQK